MQISLRRKEFSTSVPGWTLPFLSPSDPFAGNRR
jgi:hypothetical protein